MKKGKVALHYNSEEDRLELWAKGNNENYWGYCIGTKYKNAKEDAYSEPTYINDRIIIELINWVQINQYEFIGYIPESEIYGEEDEVGRITDKP